MVQPNPEFSIPSAAPNEVGPLWQELNILPAPTAAEEQMAYMRGYAAGQKAAIFLLAEDFANEQAVKQRALVAEQEATRDAATDSLTGLPNRLGITLKIDELIASKPGEFGVLFVDIDGLKETNDTLGHQAGDQLIIRGANVLESSVRGHDTKGHGAARLSGDELIVVVDGVTTEEQLELVGARIRHNLDEAGVPASLGAAMHQLGDMATDVISRADTRMYAVKEYRRELKEELQFEENRAALPAEKREFYDAIYAQLWEYPGGSPEEFRDIYLRLRRGR